MEHTPFNSIHTYGKREEKDQNEISSLHFEAGKVKLIKWNSKSAESVVIVLLDLKRCYICFIQGHSGNNEA